ncbi:oxidoreductase [Catellatospora methionotrophica]|uniref:Oxidoreductase n=1 Tax=Catellatospora methionotrophica TaxID=121620 RepID=A0A8J3PDG6_9ACTN|nr:Gfo/Idh/MocA family oxidoreductase [Catellatospora methionotrophica]GIG12333.1 oxidoreductase [Catellatospora methionotrophica]
MTTLAIVGTGNIAAGYLTDLRTYPGIAVVGGYDDDQARSAAFGAAHDLPIYGSFDELLADDKVDVVVNLTPLAAHAPVTRAALRAGKHVFSEKPLAPTAPEARSLIAEAAAHGRRLGCAPHTYLGEAIQTAWKLVRDDAVGPIKLVYAEVNHDRIESWHPAPQGPYRSGPLYDVGVYSLTALTAMLGPARRVWAYGTILKADRVTLSGEMFSPQAPDFSVVVLELAGGATVRLTANFYVGAGTRQSGIELHGERGSIHIADWTNFDSEIRAGLPPEPVPLLGDPYRGIPWGRGVAEFVSAINEGRPHRCSAEHAAHIVDVLAAASHSQRTGAPVDVTSTFPAPLPMPWAA